MTHRTEAVRKGEDALEKRLRRLLRKVGDQVAGHLDHQLQNLLGKAAGEDAATNAAINAAIEGSDWTLLIEPTQEQLELVAQDGARRALLALGVTDEGVTEQAYETASEWAKDRAAELVGMKYNDAGDLVENPDADMAITDATRAELQELVSRAIDEGMSADDLASEIEDLGSFSAERATTIARTEIIRANNQGHLQSFKDSGVVEKKEWSTAEDGDVCEECMANEDQGPIGLDQDFDSGDDAAPAHPNCRCTIIAVVDEGQDTSDEEGDDEEADDEAA